MEVPRSIFRKRQTYNFDLFLMIKDTYHLFAAQGAVLQDVHLDMIKSGGTRVYVRKSDWRLVESCLRKKVDDFIMDSDIDPLQKANIMYDSAIQSIKDVYKGILPKTIADVEKNANDLVKLILSDGNVVDSLKLINTSDHFTYQHSVRVGIYSTALTLKLFGSKLSQREISKLATGFFLHDIGMTDVPMDILEKNTKLTSSEWDLVQKHPIKGRDRLVKTGSMSYEAISIILYHHERHDGSGYPYNLIGDDIPAYAKICAMADAFESLTAQRPYRDPLAPYDALQVMFQEMAKEFDPVLFASFVKLLGPAK
jgi:HD-GYP domain-containing protein (c-di-GMP phosphodiesterase class II)